MKIKNWITTIIVAIIIFSGISIYINIKDNYSQLEDTIKYKDQKLEYYKDENNGLIAQKKVLWITNKNLKKIADNAIVNSDKLEKQIKGYKNLNTYLQGQLEIKVKDTTTIYDTLIITKNDTLYAKKFNYNNQFLDFTGVIKKNTLDFSYTYRTGFEYVTYWKRPGRFKSKELVMDFSLSDPNAILTSAQTINIKPEPEKFYQKQWFSGLVGLGIGIFIIK